MVTTANGNLNQQRIELLAEELSELIAQDRKVVLVSSGAVGQGWTVGAGEGRPTWLNFRPWPP